MQRRQFLTRAAAATLFSANAIANATQENDTGEPSPTDSSSGGVASRVPRVTSPGTLRGEMLYRPLGATGVEVSAIGMGGSHLGQATVDEDTAIRLIHEGLDRGINFLDKPGTITRDEVKSASAKPWPKAVIGKKHLS